MQEKVQLKTTHVETDISNECQGEHIHTEFEYLDQQVTDESNITSKNIAQTLQHSVATGTGFFIRHKRTPTWRKGFVP